MNFRLDSWVSAFRPPAQINLALPMLVGLSQRTPCDSRFDGVTLAQALMISLLLQAMILYANEASDATTDDPSMRTLISGGAGVGATGALTVGQLRAAAIAAGFLGFLACVTIGGVPMAGLWLLAGGLVWAYDGSMLRLSRHPLGCLCQAIGVGLIVPMLGAGSQAAWPGVIDLMIGLSLGVAGHIITALPDAAADRKVGKRTIVVVCGERAAFALMMAGLAVAALLLWGGESSRPCGAVVSNGHFGALTALVLGGAFTVSLWLGWQRTVAPHSSPASAAALRDATGTHHIRRKINTDLWLAGFVALGLWLLWAFQ